MNIIIEYNDRIIEIIDRNIERIVIIVVIIDIRIESTI